MPFLHTLAVGPLETNCYLYGDDKTGECAIIDPGGDGERIAAAIGRHSLQPTLILLTHAHFDHTGAVAALNKRYGARVGLGEPEAPALSNALQSGATWFGCPFEPAAPDFFIADGQRISIGAAELTALATPGHSAGGLSFLGDGLVFVGDVLFRDGIGRYDLPGADFETLRRSLRRLLSLPDDTRVLPGHGPATTIGRERKTNPYLAE